MGAAAQHSARIRRFIEPLDPEEAVQALERALDFNVACMAIAAFTERSLDAQEPTRRSASPGSAAQGEYVSVNLESELIALTARLLELDSGSVHPESSIMELGLDSILLVRLSRELENRYSQSVDLEILKAHPTIADLAEHLRNSAG